MPKNIKLSVAYPKGIIRAKGYWLLAKGVNVSLLQMFHKNVREYGLAEKKYTIYVIYYCTPLPPPPQF